MMRKRQLIAGFLVLTMLLSLTGMLTMPVSASTPTVKVEPEIKYAADSGAFLKNIELSQTGAWNLTVKANPTAGGQTYAVLLRYDLFNTNYNSDGSIGGINPGTYTSLQPGTSNSNYYRYENATATSGTGLTIFNKALYDFKKDNNYNVTESSSTYHMKYALVIFDGGTDVKDLSDYTIITFYMNSEGWLQTESYMLRYMQNKHPAGTNSVGNMPGYQIEGWGTDAAVNGTKQPTRVGYTFLGWDANAKLMNADANAAAVQVVTPQYPAGSTGPVPWGDIHTAFGNSAFNKDSDKFYNLHAIWRPNAVKFDITNAPTEGSVGGVNIHVLTLPEPQVGVAYDKTIALASSPTDKNTQKGYSWQNVGDTITVGSDTGTIVNLTNAYKLSVSASGNMNWKISGTPTDHSNGKAVYAVLQVKDNGNNTTDLIILHFPQVKKGAQPVPTLDDNTGLQSRVVTVAPEEGEATEDGQIFGFYSGGPKKSEESGYLNDTNGTGTMTDYYVKNRMIYEYRPVLVDGGVVDYTGLPNDGWREMPLPSNWYGDKHITGATRTAWENSMKLNAKDVIYTEYAPTTGSHAPVKVITDLPEGFEGWPDSYGWIEYEGTIPILRGLTADDQYEVRFRANTAYEVSKSKVLTIGGAVGSTETPGSSGGLAVNLSGGTEAEDPSGFGALKEAAKNLQAGQELDLNTYKFEPTREGCTFLGWTLGERDSAGNLILYRADEPKMVTVIWKDHDGTELKTASIPVGTEPEHPEAPSHEGYTFKEWSRSEDADGNITFTAVCEEVVEPTPSPEPTTTPEPEPEPTPEGPEARDESGTEPPDGGEGEEEPVDPSPEPEPSPSPDPAPAEKHRWVDGLSGETISEESAEPAKPYHMCYTAGDWVVTEEGEEGDKTTVHTLTYTRNTKVPMPAETPASLAAVWSGGSSSTDGILAVSVSDWDGVSLGTFIFRSDPDPKTQEQNAQQAISDFLAQENVASALTSHAGYDYLTFVKPDAPTSYGKRVDTLTNTQVSDLEISPENMIDFSTLKTSTSAKVAYTTNDTIQLGEGLSAAEARDARFYKTSIDSYGRFGVGNSFAVRIKVERGNVPRVTDGYLRVRMVIGGADIYSQYALSGADVETIEVVPFARSATSGALTGASIVEWTVIDAYGTENWLGSGARTTLADCQSKAAFTVRDVGTSKNQAVWDRGTYPFEGVIAGINDTLASYHALKLEDPSISPNNNNMAGVTLPIMRSIGIPPQAVATARAKLYEAYVANGAQPLDYASMYEAASGQPLQ
jgi:hypothetical protein